MDTSTQIKMIDSGFLSNTEDLVYDEEWECFRCRMDIQRDLDFLMLFESEQKYCMDSNVLQYLQQKCTWIPPFQECDQNNLLIVADIGDPISYGKRNQYDSTAFTLMLNQFSAQIAELHNLGIAHMKISADRLFYSDEHYCGTLFVFSDCKFFDYQDRNARKFIEQDWRVFLDTFRKLDKFSFWENLFKLAENLLESSTNIDSLSKDISNIFDMKGLDDFDLESLRLEMTIPYAFLLNGGIDIPIMTDGERLTEYILFYYICRFLLLNGFAVEPNNPSRVIGQSVKILDEPPNMKILSHVFG
jgi:hypothetical protein